MTVFGNKIKYKVMEAGSLANETNLNELGEEGWELVSIIKENGKFYYHFKRLFSDTINAYAATRH